MKILLLGDYSNCHNSLAAGLRRLGHEATVISDGNRWMNTGRDIDISRHGKGRLGGLMLYLKVLGPLHRHLKGYDVVAIHDPVFISLHPVRLKKIFERLQRENGSVFLTAMSTDIAFLDMVEPPSPLRYSEWWVGNEPARWNLANPGEWEKWHNPELVGYEHNLFSSIDGAVSVLYEYQLGMEGTLPKEKVAYGGMPIDVSRFKQVDLGEKIEGPVRLFLGRDRTRKEMKGSDYLEIAARRVVEHHPDKAILEIVENRPFDEFLQLMSRSHVVLDQIYSYTPATTALMAMAMGLNTVSGAEPEYYDFIGETENRPIINAPIDLDELTSVIEDVVLHPELIPERGRASRRFVEKHNDVTVVAERFVRFWEKRLREKR